jgi:hypothetical protein
MAGAPSSKPACRAVATIIPLDWNDRQIDVFGESFFAEEHDRYGQGRG